LVCNLKKNIAILYKWFKLVVLDCQKDKLIVLALKHHNVVEKHGINVKDVMDVKLLKWVERNHIVAKKVIEDYKYI